MPCMSSIAGTYGYGRGGSRPGIITSGLQLNLTPSTYSGSGTTWDNPINTTDATLYNAPTYSSAGFTFNGSTQYAGIPSVSGVSNFTASDNYTVEVWCNITASQVDTVSADNSIVEKWNGGNQGAYPFVCRFIRPSTSVLFAAYNGSLNPSVSIPITTGVWIQLVGVYDHTNNIIYGYRNGSQISSGDLTIGGTISNTSVVNIARRSNSGEGSGTNYFTGSVGIVRIYNTALSAAAVLQNFNADRGRYGI